MKKFMDSANREWIIEINVATIKRVKLLTGVDLLDIQKEKDNEDFSLLLSIYDDPIMLVDILYAICKPACDARSLSAEDFAQGMVGDAIDRAIKNFLEEYVNFFPSPKRAILAKAISLVSRFERESQEAITEYLNHPEIDAKLNCELEKLRKQFMNLPESAE